MESLRRVLERVIENNDEIHYVQGLNSLAATVLMATDGDEVATERFLTNFGRLHGSVVVAETLEGTQSLLKLIDVLVGAADPALASVLRADPTCVQYIFALSWVITWMTHDVNRFDDAIALVDALSDRGPLAILYLSALVVIGHRDAIFNAMRHSSASAAGEVHRAIAQLPSPFPVEYILSFASRLLPEHTLLASASADDRSRLGGFPAVWRNFRAPLRGPRFLQPRDILDHVPPLVPLAATAGDSHDGGWPDPLSPEELSLITGLVSGRRGAATAPAWMTISARMSDAIATALAVAGAVALAIIVVGLIWSAIERKPVVELLMQARPLLTSEPAPERAAFSAIARLTVTAWSAIRSAIGPQWLPAAPS